MKKHRPASALVLALGALVLSEALRSARGAETPPSPPIPRSTYVERDTSELVLIETYVTDGFGNPVLGLTKDDFILEVGGLRRPIFSVDFESAGAPATPASLTTAPTPGGAPGAQGAWPRRIVLFFEDDTSSPIGLTEARRAASRFLESGLAPSDQIAVAAHSDRLKILADFTTDRAVLRKAITASIDNSRRFSNFFEEALQRRYELMDNPNPMLAETLCEQEEGRLAEALSAVEKVVASLAPWRGYKGIVYFGNGVPESPYEGVWKAWAVFQARYPARAPVTFPTTCTLGDEIKGLSRAASAAGVTLHTVQTLGLSASSVRGQAMVMDRTNALETLSLNTAGTSTATNDLFLALQQIEAASRYYYQLAYVPEEPADGRYRHVVVRCRKKGVQLRYRKGFVRLPPDEARTQRIEAAYLFPEMYGGLDMEIAVAPGPGDGKDQVVDIVVHLPLERVLFLPQPDGATARLTVGLVAIDGTERRTFETSRTVTIQRPTGASPVTGLDLYCRTQLPAASQTITAVVSDDQAGAVGGTRDRIDGDPLPGPAAHGLALYSLSEKSLWVEVPPHAADKRGDPDPTEPTTGPALKTTFVVGEPIVAGFRLAPVPGDPPTTLRVEIARGGEVVRTRTVDAPAGGAGETARVPLSVEGLASGDYVVSIYAVRPDRDSRIGARAFRIVEADTRND